MGMAMPRRYGGLNFPITFDIGVEDYFDSGCLCLLEWPEKIEEILPDDTVNVTIKVNPDQSRTITIEN